jgi:hypothetical protein
MKSFGAAFLFCLAVLPLAVPAVGGAPPLAAPPVHDPAPAAPAAIPALIAELANDSFPVREAATQQLWQLGAAALEELKLAAAGADPEAAHRAKQLLHKIELHITPETDPAVIALVERYQKAALSEKIALLKAMREKRAYRQILKLYAAETDARLRGELQATVSGIAMFAARERLFKGDAAGARELLELAPADTRGLMALAAFHRANGTLEEELARAKTSTAKGTHAWQLALHRSAGNLKEAQAAAIAAGEPAIAATMAMLAGDPVPWLEHGNATHPAGQDVDLYTPLALKRWQDHALRKADLEPALKLLNSRTPSTRAQAFSSLFLLGEATTVEAAFAKSSPLDGFIYFESLERIPEALTALGLDPDQPDYTTWAATRFALLSKKPDASNTASGELIALASFLENRGLHEQLAAAFDAPLARLAKKDLDTFSGLLGALFGNRFVRTGVVGPLLGAGTAWAGDDPERWEELVAAAFGDDDETLACWKWLAELNADATPAQRLAAMLALGGYGTDPAGLRDHWLALAWAAITQANAEQQPALLTHLAVLIGQAGDAATNLKIRDLRPPNEPLTELDGLHLLQFSAAGRWEDASKIILQLLSSKAEIDPNTRPDLHAYAASCLRRAGHPDAAAVHDAWVEKLALGDASTYLRIGHGYAFGADYARCSEWWDRAAREAAPENDNYVNVLTVHAGDLLKRGLWRQAAATSEVLAQISSGPNFRSSSPLVFLRMRLQADQARGLSLLASAPAKALALLEKCHALLPCDGSLADYFFPALRQAGLIQQHDAWFESTWQQIQAVIARYPNAHNTRNTAAWLAARAMRRLDEAEAHLNKALATHPNQAAYLDTMAELQFARGNRKQAIKWSDKSVNFMPTDDDVRRQNHRFTNDPLPK